MPKFKNSKSLVKFDGTKDFATGNVDLGQVRQVKLGWVGLGSIIRRRELLNFDLGQVKLGWYEIKVLKLV